MSKLKLFTETFIFMRHSVHTNQSIGCLKKTKTIRQNTADIFSSPNLIWSLC